MSLPQQKFREMVFQLLYSMDLSGAKEEDLIPFIMHELSVTKKSVREALETVCLIQDLQPKIDEILAKTSHSYSFERIQSVERNILRLGIYELIFDQDIPPKVAIAESMRLARKFGTPESAAYVNAILDSIFKMEQGIKADGHDLEESSQKLIDSETLAAEVVQKIQESEEVHD